MKEILMEAKKSTAGKKHLEPYWDASPDRAECGPPPLGGTLLTPATVKRSKDDTDNYSGIMEVPIQ